MELNDTGNFTMTNQECVFNQPSTWKTSGKIVAYAVLFVLGFFGNLALCLVVYQNKTFRKTIDFLIVNIALTDLVIPLLAIPRSVSELTTGSDVWLATGRTGDILCKIVFFLCDVCPAVSIATLVLLTASRFAAVVFPFHASRASPKLRKYFVLSTWVISAGFFLPYFYIFKLGSRYKCAISWGPHLDTVTANQVYTTIIIVIFILIPFILTTFMYTVILYKLRRRAKGLPNQTRKARRECERSTRNITLLSFFVVLAFGLCWGPYFSVMILLNFYPQLNLFSNACKLGVVTFSAQYLAYSNAAVNPFFCLFFIKNYRKGFKKLSVKTYNKLKTRGSSEEQRNSSLLRPTNSATKDEMIELTSVQNPESRRQP